MSTCISLFGIVLHAVHVMYTCYARAVRQNRFNPGKTQEKSAPTAVAAGYIYTEPLLQLPSQPFFDLYRALRDAATVASFVSIYYILSLFVSQSFSDLCTPISRITSNDEIHMFKMQQSVCKKLPFTSPYKNGV